MRRIFVTGIGTDVGKTVVSAILTEKLQADYWKPVQCGDLENSDTIKVSRLVSNPRSVFHPESYRLVNPLSPHHAAKLENIEIDPFKIAVPESSNDNIIIEGAGGLMVPLNDHYLMIDLAKDLKAEVVLVANFYLGSINHTLLSLHAIKSYELPFLGIIFNGKVNEESERVILANTNTKLLGKIPQSDQIDASFVNSCTSLIQI